MSTHDLLEEIMSNVYAELNVKGTTIMMDEQEYLDAFEAQFIKTLWVPVLEARDAAQRGLDQLQIIRMELAKRKSALLKVAIAEQEKK